MSLSSSSNNSTARMKSEEKYFVFDFDSTFTQVEALDILCEIVLDGQPGKEAILDDVQRITNTCMEGDISFPRLSGATPGPAARSSFALTSADRAPEAERFQIVSA